MEPILAIVIATLQSQSSVGMVIHLLPIEPIVVTSQSQWLSWNGPIMIMFWPIHTQRFFPQRFFFQEVYSDGNIATKIAD